ncbi:hypothetical protein BGY98DRAFT_217939 [Russula aff. rugulosa BPL654]|nr:hypothetical protein BGY98DRAFT_217939 [Russula aff. rugulosa BPL654]
MLSKVLAVSLFAAVAVAAPAYPCVTFLTQVGRGADFPLARAHEMHLGVVYPEGINPAPSSSVILLNSPSPTGVGRIAGPQGPPVINLNPPAPSSSIILLNSPSPTGVGRIAGPQGPPVINLNPPAPSPSPSVINPNAPESPSSVINLNAETPPPVINLIRRQLSSLPPTSTFSFGGIVPSSTSLSSSGTPSFAFGGIAASSSFTPLPTATPNPGALDSTSTFSSIGPDGVKTVLLLSATTVTVSGAVCSPAPAFNPSQGAFVSPLASSAIASSSAFGANIQAPSAAAPSSPSIINLNSPPATITSALGFSFSSAPAADATPAV